MKAFLHIVFFLTLFSCNKDDNAEISVSESTPTPLNEDLIYGLVLDIDGNEYATIPIGGAIWMAENLRTTRYCNGDYIPNISDDSEWKNLNIGAWANLNNDHMIDSIYGKLYNGFAVDDSRNICPCGWHVPTSEEWEKLVDTLGGRGVVGGKLNSTESYYWKYGNIGASNVSGFSAIPSGNRFSVGSFANQWLKAFWYAKSDIDESFGPAISVSSDFRGVNGFVGGGVEKAAGLSIRCVKD